MTPAPIEEEKVAEEKPIEIPEDTIQIVQAIPPVWEKAHKAFDIDDSSTVYAYGKIIYNPAGVHIPEHVIEHEAMHMRQQEAVGGPEKWWDKYIEDTAFRLAQEIEAYNAQYLFYCACNRDRNAQARFLHQLAGYMASNMYGAPMARMDAMRAIRG